MQRWLWAVPLLLAFATAPALAQDPEDELGDEDELFDLHDGDQGGQSAKKGDDFRFDDHDEEEGMADFNVELAKEEAAKKKAAAEAARKAAAMRPLTLEVTGKEPLKGNYALAVVNTERDAVVVELPILVARSRAEVKDPFLLYGDVWVGPDRVHEVRHLVEPASLAEFGPSFAFVKVLAPVKAPTGEVKVVVRRTDTKGGGAAELFTTSTAYSLK